MWGKCRGAQSFQNIGATSILGARMVTRSKFLTGTSKTGLQGTKFKSLGRSGTQFVHPSVIYLVFFTYDLLFFRVDKQCTYNVTLRRVRVTTVAVEKQCVTYWECVSVALGIEHAMLMRPIVSGLSVALPYFSHYLTKARFSRGRGKKRYWAQSVRFDFLCNCSLKHFSF